jgi:uncharacterized membrane protein YeaQ/YmgE (transglycosylase-associated protein family)
MSPSYSILLWIIVGAVAGGCVRRGRDRHRADPGAVVAGVIGAVTGGSMVELALHDEPGTAGVIASVVVAVLGALAGQAMAPRDRVRSAPP